MTHSAASWALALGQSPSPCHLLQNYDAWGRFFSCALHAHAHYLGFLVPIVGRFVLAMVSIHRRPSRLGEVVARSYLGLDHVIPHRPCRHLGEALKVVLSRLHTSLLQNTIASYLHPSHRWWWQNVSPCILLKTTKEAKCGAPNINVVRNLNHGHQLRICI